MTLLTSRLPYIDTTIFTVMSALTITTAISAMVHPSDEIMTLKPCYDNYIPNIELASGTVVRVPLTPDTLDPTSVP